jgi:hypothetical protein
MLRTSLISFALHTINFILFYFFQSCINNLTLFAYFLIPGQEINQKLSLLSVEAMMKVTRSKTSILKTKRLGGFEGLWNASHFS